MKTGEKILITAGQYKGRWGTFIDDYPMTHVVQDPDVPHVRLTLEPEGDIIIPWAHVEICQISLSPSELLDAVYSAVSQNLIEVASDLILQHCDDWMSAGNFDECDALLSAADLDRLDAYTIIGFLASTVCAKDLMKTRKAFVEKAITRLMLLAPDRAEELMKGLY